MFLSLNVRLSKVSSQIRRMLSVSVSQASSFKFDDLQITRTKSSRPLPNKDELVFGKLMTDHMFEVHWQSDRGWDRPFIEPYHPLMIDPAAKCLHYSLEIFEGMKAYRGVDNKVRLFRPEDNFERMINSAIRSCLPTFDITELKKCLKALIELDKDWVLPAEECSLYIRPTMIGVEPSLGVANSSQALLYIICSPVGPYFPTGMKPVSLLADPEFVRAWPGGAGDSKMGSLFRNYGPTVYVQQKAQAKGCQQVLWLLGEENNLTEAGTMNVFVRLINENGEDELITPPLQGGIILPGVVRRSLLDLTRSWGTVKVSERSIQMKEVIKASKEKRLIEIFGSGTACVVCPVERILYNNVNIEVPTMQAENAVYAKLYKELNDIYYGRQDSEWTEIVC